ncbi:MAG: MBL fold metallo-hydrolase [Oscillospiraceae bacterium]|jgi:glyoxylase-like metal-dependent hydrolase (beta-lactamase superfamily II)|nr:MBL fold metallo-hydrolase [Oscillospiraceae bacterium]
MTEMNAPLPLETVKINDSTYRIEDNGVRSLLFIGREKALLVDTGHNSLESLKAVVESLTEAPIMLVNTHADADHIGNNMEFGAAHMHPSEMAYYFLNANRDAQVKPLCDSEIIDLGGRLFEVVLIPGHTPGSIALLDRENRVLVAGDSLSAGPVFMFDEVRDIHAYIISMEKLSGMMDAFDTVYPSHGSFPLQAESVGKALAAAKKLLAGELSPEEPPFPIPAKMYMHDGAGFFYP